MARERDKEWGSYCARTSIRREKIKEAGNESRDVNQLKKIKKSTNTDFFKGDRKRTTESGGGINSTIMVLNLPNSLLTLCLSFLSIFAFSTSFNKRRLGSGEETSSSSTLLTCLEIGIPSSIRCTC